MKIACIYPSVIESDCNIISGEPLGLQYIAATAKSLEQEVRIFVPKNKETLEMFVGKIIAFSPDILAFSTMTFQAYRTNQILRSIRAKGIRSFSIVGGSHASLEPEFFLQRGFDVCVYGEGEKTFANILKRLSRKKDIKDIPGIVYKNANKIIRNPQPNRANLDELPLPIRVETLLESKTYNGIAYPSPNFKAWASVTASRGCPYDCIFCSAPKMWNKKVTKRSIEKVIEEMVYLNEDYGVQLFQFVDLVFGLNNQYTINLCNEISKANLDINWFCMTNANAIKDVEMLYAMKESGCTLISIGLESTNKQTLNQINKPSHYDKVRKLTDILDSIGIPSNIFYMISFPWQTPESIYSEVDLLYRINSHKIQVFIATPFPYTPFYYKVKDRLIPNSYNLYDTNHLVFHHPYISPLEANKLRKTIFKEFYLNMNYRKRVGSFLKRFPKFKNSFFHYWKSLPFYEELFNQFQLGKEKPSEVLTN